MKGEHLGPDDSAERMRAEERHRLALYLHDHVGQILTLTKLQLARIQQALREPVDPAKQAWLQTTVDSLIPELDAVMQVIQAEVFVLIDGAMIQPVFKGPRETNSHAGSSSRMRSREGGTVT